MDVSVIFCLGSRIKHRRFCGVTGVNLNILVICNVQYPVWQASIPRHICCENKGKIYRSVQSGMRVHSWETEETCRKESPLLPQLLLGLEGWLERSSIPHVHFFFSKEKRFCSFVWSSALLLNFPACFRSLWLLNPLCLFSPLSLDTYFHTWYSFSYTILWLPW